ncbi:MAG: sigma-70 family RNA polymerase sigma factor [Oscillospiraceae bacterium]|nr:sigma-70 family RNA polymerase sigma factor [Oscillospiraceae bacterium]
MRLSAEEAFRLYGDRLFAIAFSVCRNRADADDVVQDTFLKYHTQNRDFESPEHIKAWLIRVAVNRAKDLTTSFWRKNKVTWEEYMGEAVFEDPADSRIFEAVMNLPKKYRIVIHLYYYEEYSVREIAHILRCRDGTVKSQLSRGRVLLKNMLREEWNDDE